jgi:hypothetical protein
MSLIINPFVFGGAEAAALALHRLIFGRTTNHRENLATSTTAIRISPLTDQTGNGRTLDTGHQRSQDLIYEPRVSSTV